MNSQISDLFSTFLSSSGIFNTLIEAVLNTLTRHEHSLFDERNEDEQINNFHPF